MYNENAKKSAMKYRKNSRDQIQIDIAKGTKGKIKAFAEKNGTTMSALIMRLLEAEMSKDAEFCAEWTAKEEAERKAEEQAMQAEVDAIRAENGSSKKAFFATIAAC